MKKTKNVFFIIIGIIFTVLIIGISLIYGVGDSISNLKLRNLLSGIGVISYIVIFVALLEYLGNKFHEHKYKYVITCILTCLIIFLSMFA